MITRLMSLAVIKILKITWITSQLRNFIPTSEFFSSVIQILYMLIWFMDVIIKSTVKFAFYIVLFLFPGLIGSLFSFLQFLSSPLMGAASDVYGRKPMLLVSMVSHVLLLSMVSQSEKYSSSQ